MTVLRQVTRTARRLSKRQCWACNLRILAGDRYTERAVVEDGRIATVVEHEQCARECEAGEEYDWGFLASDPSVGSDGWQRWHHRRVGLGYLARDLAHLFAQRVAVAMARGAIPAALGDLVATYSPLRRVA